MSQFSKIISARNLAKHDGRPLWRYNLSDDEFALLRTSIMNTRGLDALDLRDCALLYAEWWKRCYEGGYPSKADVFSVVKSNQFYNAEEFYNHAKRGATLLHISWIRQLHTLYFKTLLLQGGLPLRHMAQNRGAYSDFLRKILALRPTSIDDFAFDSALTNLLPRSARNDEIYECCLVIVRAILNDGRAILNDDDQAIIKLLESTEGLKEIVGTLRIAGRQLPVQQIQRKIRTNWVLEPEKKLIRLYLSIQELSEKELISLLDAPQEIELKDGEYRLFYNDSLLCKLIRRGKDTYCPIWVNQDSLSWVPSQQIPQLYVLDSTGRRLDCPRLITYQPRLDEPTLWTRYSEKQFILERGRNTSESQGYVLGPEQCNLDDIEGTSLIEVANNTLYWTTFTGELAVSQYSRKFCFRTGTRKFDWLVQEEKPDWMYAANMKAIRRNPSVHIFDNSGNRIADAIISWKKPSTSIWNTGNSSFPLGCIELKLQVGDVVEYDECYNIGALNISTRNQQLHNAILEITGNKLAFTIHQSDTVQVEENTTGVLQLSLLDINIRPVSIASTLKLPQEKSLRFGLRSPFVGTAVVNNDERVVNQDSNLLLNNLNGYRIVCNQAGASIRLRNSRIPALKRHVPLNEFITPLRHLEDTIRQLFSLSNPLKEGTIEMALCIEDGGHNTTRSLCHISRYSGTLILEETDAGISVTPTIEMPELLAVPLDSSESSFDIFALPRTVESFLLQETVAGKQYMIFGSGLDKAPIKPVKAVFRSTPLPTEGDVDIKAQNGYDAATTKEVLLTETHSESLWQHVLFCHKLCIEHDLPFTSFKALKEFASSPALAARAFVFLLSYNDAEGFNEAVQARIELELGFCFHWLSRKNWEQAMEWIGCFTNNSTLDLIFNQINNHFRQQQPSGYFIRLAQYIAGQTFAPDTGFSLRTAIQMMRSSLGPEALKALPYECPEIPERYRHIISLDEDTQKVRLMLLAPLAAALSISGSDDLLWKPHAEQFRRNIQYCYQLNPDWYAKGLIYSLAQL